MHRFLTGYVRFEILLFSDPRYRDSASEVFQKLQTSTSAIKSRSSASLGRFISAGFGPGHEIYFIFDFSRSVHDNELNSSLEFAVKLIERVSMFEAIDSFLYANIVYVCCEIIRRLFIGALRTAIGFIVKLKN